MGRVHGTHTFSWYIFSFSRRKNRNRKTNMGLAHFLVAFLAIGVVAAEEAEYIEGLSADEILNGEFPVEYTNDDRSIDEIIQHEVQFQQSARHQQLRYAVRLLLPHALRSHRFRRQKIHHHPQRLGLSRRHR